jgi:hypothetical protein
MQYYSTAKKCYSCSMNERNKNETKYPPPEAEDPEEEQTPQIDPLTIEDPPEYPGPGA